MEDRIVGKYIFLSNDPVFWRSIQVHTFHVNISEKQHSAELITLANIIAFQVHGAEPPPGVTCMAGDFSYE